MALIDISTIGFAGAGEDIRVFELTRITAPESILLGSHIVVDDFVFIRAAGASRSETTSI
jgi:hypothetical protein